MKSALLLTAGLVMGAAGMGCAGGHVSGERLESRGVVFEQLPTLEKYAVYVPRGEAPQGGWPCIVFLNGRGECGTDGQRQLTQGLLPAVLNKPEEWPFVIVFPQKPTQKSKWIEHKAMVMACLDRTERQLAVNTERVYLTGLSQGGNGTWEIAAATPGVFAAIAPVCGFVEPDAPANRWPGDGATIAEAVLVTPVWAFHGEKDDVVKPVQSRRMVASLDHLASEINAPERSRSVEIAKDDGAASQLRLTVYPDLNHGCWDRAYRDSGLAAWFLRFGK